MTIDPRVDIGHVHLKVADIDRALAFYCGVLGFEEQARCGDQAAFISAGGYHHHIGLNTWESKGGTPPPPGHTGLYHAAIRYPDRRRSRMRFGVSSTQASRWTARRTTASARRCTCATRTATGSSCTATARAKSGRCGADGEGLEMFTPAARRPGAPRRKPAEERRLLRFPR